MKKGGKKKDPWAQLPEEFRAAVDGADETECKKRIGDVAKANDDLQRAKEEDDHLKETREAFSTANAGYREAEKMTRMKIRYLGNRLRSLGKA